MHQMYSKWLDKSFLYCYTNIAAIVVILFCELDFDSKIVTLAQFLMYLDSFVYQQTDLLMISISDFIIGSPLHCFSTFIIIILYLYIHCIVFVLYI